MAEIIKNKTKKRIKNSDSFWDKVLTILLFPIRIFLYYFLFQLIFRIIFKFNHRMKFVKNGIKLPKEAFLVLGNHVTDWDGLYINTFFNRFVYFIVHDEIFKYKFRKIIAYNLFGQIKRGKEKTDIGPLRKLIELRDSGHCIGIYPEGDISYTGQLINIDKSIAKLCKILNMPIVLTRIDGATFQRPRWSYKSRKIKIQMTITDLIPADDVKNYSNEILYDRIICGIKYNDSDYQKNSLNLLKAVNPAENLENVLFLCPDCHNIHCMESKKDKLYCKKCGYTVKYNNNNQFELIKGKRFLLNIVEWDKYQKQQLTNLILKSKTEGKEIISIDNFSYNKVSAGNFFYKPQKTGNLSINYERIKFTCNGNNLEEIFYIKDIKDLYIQFKGAVEFSVNNYRYRFISTVRQHYGYWFECFIIKIKEQGTKLNG